MKTNIEKSLLAGGLLGVSNLNLKIFFLAISCVGIFGLAEKTFAACAGSSPTWTTGGNTAADVNACITNASSGDTINVVAGSGVASWGASAVTIPVDKPLNIIGPGSGNLTITIGGNHAFAILPYAGSLQSPGARISGFKFLSPLDAKYSAIKAQGQYWRIDHCAYESVESANSTTGGFFVEATGVNTTVQPYGLIDHNAVINGKIDGAGALNSYDETSTWLDDLDLGGPTAIYVEDNTFSTSYPTVTAKHLMFDGGYGSKMVFRYNMVSNGDVQEHGLQSAGDRGSRKVEYYGNAFNYLNDSGFMVLEFLAGTGVAFYNDITGVAPSYGLGFEYKREGTSVGCLGECDGTHAWDGNESGQNGWLCRDQPGTGGDSARWNNYNESCSGTPTAQTKLPIYAFLIKGASNDLYNYSPTHVIANRDYYYTDSTHCPAGGAFCSQGVGAGTLAQRPSSCTTGVAYWATNQSTSDYSGMVGANPSTPINGTLYKCTATNTWTAYYTPYAYPHPLQGTADMIPPAVPSGLSVE